MKNMSKQKIKKSDAAGQKYISKLLAPRAVTMSDIKLGEMMMAHAEQFSSPQKEVELVRFVLEVGKFQLKNAVNAVVLESQRGMKKS